MRSARATSHLLPVITLLLAGCASTHAQECLTPAELGMPADHVLRLAVPPARQWTPDMLKARDTDTATPVNRLVLNAPAFRLDVYIGDEEVRSFPTAIGMRRYPTPRGSFTIRKVEWNPWWIPPDSWWARKEKVTPPSETNPMGRVKLEFERLYYVHGTPWPSSIGRAAAHGCVRMRNTDAIEVARLVQRGTVGVAANDSIMAAFDSGATIAVTLPRAVPFEVRYDLVEILGDSLIVHPDPYALGRVPPLETGRAVLAAAGLDTSAVDFARLRRLRRYPRRDVALAVRWP